MERLTRIFEKDNQKYVCIDVCGKKCVEGYSECHDCEPFINVMKKLAEYEDLEEQGLLIKLPCEVGDRFWELNAGNGFARIYPRMAYSLQHCVYVMERLGKTVFLTKAEAEKALEEMKGE